LPIPHLDIQIWSNVKYKHNNISSKKLEKGKEKITFLRKKIVNAKIVHI
jgi:hypothetical protein